MLNVRNLQTKLRVAADGIAGPITFTALFMHLGAKPDRARELGRSAADNFYKYGIMENDLRLAHFMAQLMHESGSFRYMEEIASGSAYEGRLDLGNTKAGDGRRYKGRGPIQLTGRKNYRDYGHQLNLPLEDNPGMVAEPYYGLLVALEYWKVKGLNTYADRDDILTITKRINGGYNGLEDRKKHLVTMKRLLT